MKGFTRVVISLAIVAFIGSCQNRHVQQTQEKISQEVYQKIARICPDGAHKALLVYYFDGDCAICLGKAGYIEKYADAHELKPVLIAKTMNPAEFQYNLKKLNIRACVHIEENREFEKKVNFMKVTKINADRSVENYDKEIENNQ